ncbi:MAG: DUF2207 domain-containing protein, partial [Actinomycetales bacterium]|nr:DUF2207 domain-containing protein [Actinomycetales bacterium]
GRRGATDPCGWAARAGTQASFAGGSFNPGQVLTVAVGWPHGTFEGAEIILERKPEPGYVTFFTFFDPSTDGGFLAAWILVLGAGGALVLAWWSGRDRAFVGVTPGLAPTQGMPVRVGRRPRKEPVAVRFEPPSGLRPGLVGTILDGFADPRDVTATIVDLAVRGYLRIEEVEKTSRWNVAGSPEWRIVRLESGGPELRDFEASVLGGIFPGGQTKTRLASMRLTFAMTMGRVQRELDEEAMLRRWFRWSPYLVSRVWRVVGKVVMTGAGIIGLLVLVTRPSPGVALPYLAALAVGGVVVLAGKHAWGRTPWGSAAHAQVLGFKQYIATAEANQLRFEEGDDVFSRYLPYAIVFGETERWSRVFEDLAAQGRVAQDLTWYSGAESSLATFTTSTAAFSTALASFTAAANVTFTPPATSGSSGDSGFSGGGSSGGGGSAGGGGGGGGGGGW